MAAPSRSDAFAFYDTHYEVVAHYPFAATRKIALWDDQNGVRRCRFCECTEPYTAFQHEAHAIPEFLGNRSVISMNECDRCNSHFARELEDHLSKWSLSARALSGIRGKSGRPTFKNPAKTTRVSTGKTGLDITFSDPHMPLPAIQGDGPHDFCLPNDLHSQPYIPLRAALALVKAGCSICPADLLSQCRPAIHWLLDPSKSSPTKFPVLYAFIPGPVKGTFGEAILLRRTDQSAFPFLSVLLQFGNHRLQTFIPYCPADRSWMQSGAVEVEFMHLPTHVPDNWPYGGTQFRTFDWSGTQPIQSAPLVSFRMTKMIRRESSPNADDSGPE